ncbi:energy-coupling factor transporter transmembrane protein EcfT [Nocardia cyriacigeorgica]|uniref:energy-coupling factor transporter transmembrane component T family protein n=1 Tax=Nocardia cyriacigeorgica TaxID=135487 RepID=UPI0013BB7598|nr:energy-coupling factor transporter transmembrane component T [Nocardia cyriacigeorgica]NEW51176.1 energy-coupling factor transporter transmembrane protein EcfT [Nocardia cyriacigeorgica]
MSTLTQQDPPIQSWHERRLHLDPRTKILLVLGASVIVMAPGGARFSAGCIVVGMLLAIGEGAWPRVLGLPAAAGVSAAVAYALPTVIRHPVIGIIATVAAYLVRLIAIGGIAAHLVRTTGPAEFTAALRAARIPRALTVSATVMLRFVPTIVAEARAVRDAMRLRGLGGVRGWLRHPIMSIEYFTVPLIASSLRVADDLSATALLRGLGSSTTPTSMNPPRMRAADAIAAVVAAAIVLATLRYGGRP